MASGNLKAPPTFEKGDDYQKWVKKLKIWTKLTTLETAKQGPAVLFALSDEAQDTVLELEEDKIAHANGVNNIILCLDKLYLKDKTQTAFDALEAFESYKRPHELSITDYCNEFEKRYNKTKSYGTVMTEDVLAYRLLKSANLPESQQQLAKATILELKYENMKTQLKKIHGCKSSIPDIVKKESIEPLIVEEESADETLLQTNFNRGYGAGARSQQGPYRSFSTERGRGYPRQNRGNSNTQNTRKRGRNPLDQYGNPTTCIECNSINHWLNNCPDRGQRDRTKQTYLQECDEYEYEENSSYKITLFQSNYDEPHRLKSLVAESMNCGVLDSGASKTVCGKPWFQVYLDSLEEEDRSKITYKASSNIFKFGDGNKVNSVKQAEIPAVIGNVETMIQTDIVNSDIPLLLSKSSMKRAATELNFKDDTVNILGQNLPLRVTSSGHYTLPLSRNQHIMERVKRDPQVKITLFFDSNLSKEDVARKLHRQFVHPPPEKLIKLLKCAQKDDSELIEFIRKVSKECKVCIEFRRPPPRPVVGLPMATTFGECVAMDLKMFHGTKLLHMIDHATRLSACAIVKSKQPEEIISKIFKVWISVYGCPEKFLTDNGGEFSNEDFRQLCEKVNITVKTTGAESPWSNGMCERHNQVLGEMLEKTLADSNCKMDIAVDWCINAKNSLQNVHGFSPFQLVFGRNPRIPGILTDRLPALDDFSAASIIRDNLNALNRARQAFIASESSEKLRRALRHNVRTSGDVKYVTGDKVYYKRATEVRWRGPAVVLGQDGQQVLVKHGGTYVRVHPCRLNLARQSTQTSLEINTSPEITPLTSNKNKEENKTIRSSDSEGDDSDNDPLDPLDPLDTTTTAAPQANLTRPRGRPSSNKSKETSVKNDSLKVGMVVKYKVKDNDTWYKTQLVSRSGKSKGKYKNEWNTVTDSDNQEVLDFDRQVSEWNEVLEDEDNITLEHAQDAEDVSQQNTESSEEIHISDVYLQEIEDDTMKAKMKELNSWLQHDVYEEIENKGQNAISVRWVISPKMIDGRLQTKARLCARGFEESSEFRTDSPACTREGVRIAIELIATMSWILHSIDYKTAFLQGNAIEREVYLKPPKESNTNKLWKLKKTVYGLADAPRMWFLTLKKELLKLGVKQSTYDQGLFYWYNADKLEGIMVCFVDDQLWGGSTEFENKVIQKLRNTFDINYEHSSALKYVGIDLKQDQTSSISINQESYLKGINPLTIEKGRSTQKEDSVTEKEKKQLRMIVGQLNWLSGISRPDISFRVSEISSAIKEAKVSDLFKANKVLKYLKNTQSYIQFPNLSNIRNLRIVMYSDASYNNLPDGGSQGGHLVFLSDDNDFCCPLAWKSIKVRRTVRSTLAAETLAMVDGLDTAYLMAKIVGELISNSVNFILPIECVTDNRSLFEAAQTINSLTDKRLRVEMSIIRQMLDKNEMKIKWIRSNEQLADVLTKQGASSESLCRVLNIGHF